MDQVSNPVPNRSGYEQRCQRLFRCISTDRSPSASALLIYGGGRLTCLICDAASGTLDRIYRLKPGVRRFLGQVGGLIHRGASAFPQLP